MFTCSRGLSQISAAVDVVKDSTETSVCKNVPMCVCVCVCNTVRKQLQIAR